MITIIDYGMGNLKSVVNACRFLNIEVNISDKEDEIRSSKALILPGVGAFPDSMKNLKKTGLDKVIIEEVRNGKPLLGICLGMQMLFDKSYEGEECEGLGLIEGTIERLSGDIKIPHIGWNSLDYRNEDILLNHIDEGSFVYYVHSYYANVKNKENLIATSRYGDIDIPGLVRNKNVFGAQFHPEKSGDIGLKILKNFKEAVL